MSSDDKCKECGTVIPADSPGGFCAQCLLRLGLRAEAGGQKSEARPNETAPPTEKAGDRIGRYRLLQEIGHGGCGVVYMAEQEEPVRRKVALKVIKLGMDTRQVVARFDAERQALALMDHPNIAKVLDAGATETGRPFFVMELVGGLKITDYCDQNHLTTCQRLDLFIEVCLAVQHAHQKGIIHRDIKPSNVLVATQDGVPVPKVIDFGIAKATQGRLTDETVFTAFEQFLGTPAYMSPEQAQLGSLDVDTRSDIYSLGVLLYELLTGGTPFDTKELVAAGLDEMRRTIREVEPVKPSTRLTQELVAAPRQSAADSADENGGALPRRRYGQIQELIHSLRGDLDWIVMKCLEKERARRYETANGLARDIERHLSNEPVIARPPSKLYEFQKTFRRHKFGFAATAAIIFVLAGGATLSAWQAIRATRAEREQSRLREQAQTAQASEAREREKAQTEAAKSHKVAKFLEDMLQSVGPSVARGRGTTILRDILDQTTARVGKDLTTQPEVQIALQAILAETYLSLGLPRQAESVAREALQHARRVYGDKNLVTARLLMDIGYARYWLEDPDQATDFIRKGLATQRELLPHDHLDIANSLDRLADTLKRFARAAEAEAPQREALAIKRKLLGDQDPSLAASSQLGIILPSLAGSLNQLGLILLDLGRLEEADVAYKGALRLVSRDSPDAALSLHGVGRVLAGQGKLADAEATLREALDLYRKNKVILVNWALNDLAGVLRAEDKLSEAEMCYREAVAINQKDWADHPQALAITLNGLLDVLMLQRKCEEAEKALDAVLTPDVVHHARGAMLLGCRVDFLARRGRWREAASYASKAMDLQPTDSRFSHQLAVLLVADEDLDAYRRLCQRILTQISPTNRPLAACEMALDCLILPSSGVDTGLIAKLLDAAASGAIQTHPRYLSYQQFIVALSEYRRGQFSSAVEWARKCSDNPTASADHNRLVQSCMVLAMAQFQLKRREPAEVAVAKGAAVSEKLLTLESGDLGADWGNWIIAQALMREARALIGSVPADTPHSPKP